MQRSYSGGGVVFIQVGIESAWDGTLMDDVEAIKAERPHGVPYQFLLMMPYIVSILVVVIFRTRSGQPAALGVPYHRA